MSTWCQVCGSADMTTGVDGSYFCQSCGNQNDSYLEEAFDNDEGQTFNIRFVRETRLTITQNESQAATQRSEIPQQILVESQAFISQLATGEEHGPSPADVFGTPFGVGSCPTPSQTPQLPASQTGRTSQKPQKQAPIDKDELSNSIRKSYVEGIQMILLMQCETLVKNFSVAPLICGIIGPLWLRYLASTRVFEKAWADEVLEVAEDRERRRKNSRRRVFKEHEGDPELPEESETPMKMRGALGGPKKPRRRRARRRAGVVEPRTTYGRKARYVWLSALKERIPLSITLGLSYLACYVARETILPTDIRWWALKGKLPFLAAYVELSKPSDDDISYKALIGFSRVFPMDAKLMFRPKNVVGARAVELLAGHVAERIGLQLPPVSYHALSGRFLHAMKLPVEKLSVYTDRIYEWYCPTGLWLTSKESALPTRIYVMAMIIVVLKVLYKLDGRVENQISESESAISPAAVRTTLHNEESGEEDKNAAEDMQVDHMGPDNSDADVTSQKQKIDVDDEVPKAQGAAVTTRKVKVEQVWDVKELVMHMMNMKPFRRKRNTVGDDERKLAAYLKYCHDVIYPGATFDCDEEKMREYFWTLYEKKAKETSESKKKDASDEDFEDGTKRGEEAKSGHLGHNVHSEARTDVLRTGAHDSAGSVAGLRNTVQSRKAENGLRIRLHSSGRKIKKEVNEGGHDNATDADVKQESDSEMEDFDPTKEDVRTVQERTLQMLMKEMKKVGFSCLPPLKTNEVPDDVYVKYRYQISDKHLRPVHVEYFIILRVCAKLIKVHPKALHWGVQKVEQGLVEVENNTRTFMLNQGGEIAKLYKEIIGERNEYRVRDRYEEFKRKKRKLMQARYRVDEGFGSEKDYTDLILHADYL